MLRQWVLKKMQRIMASRKPDFIIGKNQLLRWWVLPRNKFFNVYLHQVLGSDDDRALHDHPWVNVSWLLDGGYIEVTPRGRIACHAGSFVVRMPTTLHRLEMATGQTALSLFITGPVVRTWGFACPKGWVPWRQFVDDRDSGQVGRGCGE